MSAVEYCICIEELARVDPSIALSVAAHNGLAVAHLSMFGSEAQKQQFLVPLAKGETLGAWGLTEAGAGSDAGAMRTTAERDGDGWVLNGSKQFITHGAIGGTLVVMAVTDRDQGRAAASRRSSWRAARRAVRPARRRTSSACARATRARSMLEDCRVPGDALVGARGRGVHQRDAGARRRAASASPRWRWVWRRAPTMRPRQLRARTPPVRPGDRVVPGDPLEARRHGDAHRGGAAADVSRRLDARPARSTGRPSSRRSPSSTRARSPCAPPRSACRFTAATGS